MDQSKQTYALLFLALPLLACSSGSGSDSTIPAQRELLPPNNRSLEDLPGEANTIEQSDIFKRVGARLYIQNPTLGLSVIDLSNTDQPTLLARLTTVVGRAGELYISGSTAFVVFKESSVVTGDTEVVAVEAVDSNPVISGRITVGGELVDSRLRGNLLYLVCSELVANSPTLTIYSIDVSNPSTLSIVDQIQVAGSGDFIHVTSQAIYLAKDLIGAVNLGTRIQYIDISDLGGMIVARGEIDLPGAPHDHLHMSAEGTRFRVVTFEGRAIGSHLHVIDVSNPDQLTVIGSLAGLAPGEDLRATRFVGDKAYIVTYQPVIIVRNIVTGGFDPLFVVSLQDPTNPQLLGELQIPGWSDYVFPRSDRLVAVGRGDLGARVAVSLFDVSDPTNPSELRRLEFGIPQASSEANTDFRGATIIEANVLGSDAMVVVPFSNNQDVNGVCSPEHKIQFIDLLANDLVQRGELSQVGLVRRTLPVGSKLYSITDKTLNVVDVSDRDSPVTTETVTLGDLAAAEQCTEVWLDRAEVRTRFQGGCDVAVESKGGPENQWPLALLLAVLLLARRRGS